MRPKSAELRPLSSYSPSSSIDRIRTSVRAPVVQLTTIQLSSLCGLWVPHYKLLTKRQTAQASRPMKKKNLPLQAKATAPRPPPTKPPPSKPKPKSQNTSLSQPPSLSKLQKGKANLKRLLKKMEQADNPYASQDEPQEFTTNNVSSSAYTTSLENINTKEQTFATIEENRHEMELKNIWAEEFEENGRERGKGRGGGGVKTARKEQGRSRNRSCGVLTGRKSLNRIVRSAFNSLDSQKDGRIVKQPKKNPKKTKKTTKQPQPRTTPTPPLLSPRPKPLTSPRTFLSPRSSLSPHPLNPKLPHPPTRSSPKKKLQLPSFNQFQQPSKKITQVSDQQLQCSIVKSKTLKSSLKIIPMKKTKAEVMRGLREQIRQRVMLQYPALEVKERRLLCAVILVQRLWRQSRVKNIIGQFLTPRKGGGIGSGQMGMGITFRQKQEVKETKLMTPTMVLPTKQQFLLVTPTKHRPSPFQSPLQSSSQSPSSSSPIPNSANSSSPAQPISPTGSLPSSLSSTLTTHQQHTLLRFVDSYRDMVLTSKKHRQKVNFFSLTSSLSDKCLMERFYKKINKLQFEEKESQRIYDKLVIKKAVKEKQRVEENKAELCTVLSTERFYTEVKEENQGLSGKNSQQQVDRDLKKRGDEYSPPHQQQPEPTITSDNIVINSPLQKREVISNFVVDMLLDEFLEEFVRDSKKHKLKSKKKKLPGIKISRNSIKKYLDGLIGYVLDRHKEEVHENLNKIIGVDPKTLLRFLRDEFEEVEGEEDDEYCKGPVLPKQVFFEYQTIFQNECFKLQKQQQKYVNFIQGILKIHNKSLLDCFTQTLDTVRIYGLRGKPYPWQPCYSPTPHPQIPCTSILGRLHKAQLIVEKYASYKLGNLDKRSPHYLQIQEQNLLFSLKEDYVRDQHEWDLCSEEMLEMELEVGDWVWDWVVAEAVQEIIGIMGIIEVDRVG